MVYVLWRAAMPEGKIKKLISDRGFGFIEGERGELFFHHSDVQGVSFDDLREGQLVQFEIGQGRKGPCATSVRIAVQTA
jgi:CspA family cold shock protein